MRRPRSECPAHSPARVSAWCHMLTSVASAAAAGIFAAVAGDAGHCPPAAPQPSCSPPEIAACRPGSRVRTAIAHSWPTPPQLTLLLRPPGYEERDPQQWWRVPQHHTASTADVSRPVASPPPASLQQEDVNEHRRAAEGHPPPWVLPSLRSCSLLLSRAQISLASRSGLWDSHRSLCWSSDLPTAPQNSTSAASVCSSLPQSGGSGQKFAPCTLATWCASSVPHFPFPGSAARGFLGSLAFCSRSPSPIHSLHAVSPKL